MVFHGDVEHWIKENKFSELDISTNHISQNLCVLK